MLEILLFVGLKISFGISRIWAIGILIKYLFGLEYNWDLFTATATYMLFILIISFFKKKEDK